MRCYLAGLLLCLVIFLQGLDAKKGESVEVCYKTLSVIDIARTDLRWEELSRFNVPLTYAPRIHNSGDVTYNTRSGGALWNCTMEVRRLPFDGKFAHFHAIAKNEAILASLINDDGSLSWFLWPSTNCRKMDPMGIGCYCDDGGRVFYRDLNSSGMVAGVLEKADATSCSYYGVARCADGPLNILYPGVAWSLSENGYVYANNSSSCWNKPYLWHPKGGFLILSDTCKMPQGNFKFENGVFNYDDTVIGTYYCDSNPQHHLMFHWEPCYENFSTHKGGFRIASINSAGTMVGTLNGRAMIQQRGEMPRDLNAMIQNSGGKWFLIEATDINDIGQIVGYGIYNGQTHIFLVEPARKVQKIIVNHKVKKGCK